MIRLANIIFRAINQTGGGNSVLKFIVYLPTNGPGDMVIYVSPGLS